jgi:hypothetical protein
MTGDCFGEDGAAFNFVGGGGAFPFLTVFEGTGGGLLKAYILTSMTASSAETIG